MQPNKTKLALAIGAFLMGASGASYAASEQFNVTVTTLPDVSIVEETVLSYGANMFTTNGATCFLDAAVPGSGEVSPMQYQGNGGNVAVGGTYGDISGSGCVDGSGGTPGLYTISGLAGQAVTLTVTGVSNADFTFAPNSGCVVDYNGSGSGTDDSGDACVAFIPGTPSTGLTLANALATEEGSAQTGNTVGGEMMLTIGGTITINQELTAAQAYSDFFTVDVVY